MRVVVDTNVFVSAFLTPAGNSAKILDLILSRRITLLITPDILAEYTEVLRRPEFSFEKETTNVFLRVIALYAEKVSAAFQLSRALPDSDDLPFLACALGGQADFLITGNKKHFPPASCHPVKPVSPAEFLKE